MKIPFIVAGLTALALVVTCLMFSPLPNAPAREASGERQSTEHEGRQITWYVQGSGPRVLLAASAGREASDFNELAASLAAAGYRTLAVEAPGIKGTDLFERPADLFDLAADMKAVLAADGGETAAIIGHAFGNRVARATAAKYPDTIHGVVLIAAGGARPIPEKANDALKNCFNPLRPKHQRLEDIRYGFFAEGNDMPDHWVTGWYARTAIFQGKAKDSPPYAQWGHGGAGPMLILQAESDTIAPAEDAGQLLAAEYPARTRLVMIEKAGHALLPEQPGRISEEVIRFLNGLDR